MRGATSGGTEGSLTPTLGLMAYTFGFGAQKSTSNQPGIEKALAAGAKPEEEQSYGGDDWNPRDD